MSERRSRPDSIDSNGEEEAMSATVTALGLASVNFFRLFFVTLVSEGLLPGFVVPPSDVGDGSSNHCGMDCESRGHPIRGGNLSVPSPVIVPNYCTGETSSGPFYTVTRGVRVGIYNSLADAFRAAVGLPNSNPIAFRSQAQARSAFVEAWFRGEVLETSCIDHFTAASSSSHVSHFDNIMFPSSDSDAVPRSSLFENDRLDESVACGSRAENITAYDIDSDFLYSKWIEGE